MKIENTGLQAQLNAICVFIQNPGHGQQECSNINFLLTFEYTKFSVNRKIKFFAK